MGGNESSFTGSEEAGRPGLTEHRERLSLIRSYRPREQGQGSMSYLVSMGVMMAVDWGIQRLEQSIIGLYAPLIQHIIRCKLPTVPQK